MIIISKKVWAMIEMLDRQSSNESTQQLVNLLNDTAQNEMLTHRLYRAYIDVDNSIPDTFLALFQQAVEEDQLHFHAIASCIERLGIKESNVPLMDSQKYQKEFELISSDSLLCALCRSETFSIQAYSQICAMTIEQDYRTFDLSFQHLHENVTHLDMVKRLMEKSSTSVSRI